MAFRSNRFKNERGFRGKSVSGEMEPVSLFKEILHRQQKHQSFVRNVELFNGLKTASCDSGRLWENQVLPILHIFYWPTLPKELLFIHN